MVDLWINDRLSLHERFVLTLGSRFTTTTCTGALRTARQQSVPAHGQSAHSRNLGRGFRAPDLGQLYYRFQNHCTSTK